MSFLEYSNYISWCFSFPIVLRLSSTSEHNVKIFLLTSCIWPHLLSLCSSFCSSDSVDGTQHWWADSRLSSASCSRSLGMVKWRSSGQHDIRRHYWGETLDSFLFCNNRKIEQTSIFPLHLHSLSHLKSEEAAIILSEATRLRNNPLTYGNCRHF